MRWRVYIENMETIKYSFVLPAYKARFFKEALDSILAQTYKDFELIIVNDASPEDLTSIVKSYDDPRIRYYINEENIGGKDLVAQWNHCLEYAKGEYVILASDDDLYHHEYLEKMNVLVDKYPEVNVFRPRIQYINENRELIYIEGVLTEYTDLLEFIYFLNKKYISSGIPFYILNKKCLLESGGFVNRPIAWGSDDATAIVLAQKGIVSSNMILFSFRMSGENISSQSNDLKTLSRKIEATNQHLNWLTEKVDSYSSQNSIAAYYKRSILDNIKREQIGHISYLIQGSSSGAAINYLIRLFKEKKIPLHAILTIFAKRFILRRRAS